ncbi:MAG: glucose-6-phosphate isomerase [Desulfosarcinaceae bacterium]|nr:glucose-6-phosphate isomerase [Desulfosarcinaceae bacterium]
MTSDQLLDLPVSRELRRHADRMQSSEKHLRHLIAAPDRLKRFSQRAAGLFFDYSRQRLDADTLDLLMELAAQSGVEARFRQMHAGQVVNVTEGRAAMHTIARTGEPAPVIVDGIDANAELRRVRAEIAAFVQKVHDGATSGGTGKRFRHVVVVGIGGSYLGTEFVATALAAFADKGVQLHFLANVDIHNFGAIAGEIDLEATLWIVISKSYTTAETLANETQARSLMETAGLDAAQHLITVTAKGSPGDDPAAVNLQSFHMFDFIGGRYSVTSAVGGVPLSLYLGNTAFERFLTGAAEMDSHALSAPTDQNLPLMAALISIWNASFLGYAHQGIIPYAQPLAKLAPHIQQLNMESNGKSVTMGGTPLKGPAGIIIFGEPGTNAQHSFFQLAHQGRPFPVDFIGVLQPQYTGYNTLSKGVTNHQELWANMMAQANALAVGKEAAATERAFSGNRPSSTLVLESLAPEDVGRLLAFYEARTVYEAFIWGINPFDQFGVELGKVMASDIRTEMAARNQDEGHRFDTCDPITRFYLETLFRGRF